MEQSRVKGLEKLEGYANVANRCKDSDEVKAMLDELEKPIGVTGGVPCFSCIVAPSGTGKTQLAASAAAAGKEVVYFFTGCSADHTQPFYRPHEALRNQIFSALAEFCTALMRHEVMAGSGATAFLSHAGSSDSAFHLFGLLKKCLFCPENTAAPSPLSLAALRAEIVSSGRKFMVFLDEIPSRLKDLQAFDLVMALRNVLRAAGISPILMSTHSGSINAVTTSAQSREDDDNPVWCKIYVNLPKYVPDKETKAANTWVVPSERPWVATLMIEHQEKLDVQGIVPMLQVKIQRAKRKAWAEDPVFQLCQLFRTKSGSETSEDISPECKHLVVGTQFGRIHLEGGGDSTVVQRDDVNSWMDNRRVGFVDPEIEPFLFLALTSWKMECLLPRAKPHFPLVDSSLRAISVMEAFNRSPEYFKQRVASLNPEAQKNDGDLLEVLALASTTLASLQADDGVLMGVPVSRFLASVFCFMCPGHLNQADLQARCNDVEKLLKHEHLKFLPPTIPTCACAESSFASVWPTLASSTGTAKRPPDKDMRDGYIVCGDKTVVHIECKNLRDGVDTTVLKNVTERLRDGCKMSILFASKLNRTFTKEEAWERFVMDTLQINEPHKLCFLEMLMSASGPNFRWLQIENGGEWLELSPRATTDMLVVIIATGEVCPYPAKPKNANG